MINFRKTYLFNISVCLSLWIGGLWAADPVPGHVATPVTKEAKAAPKCGVGMKCSISGEVLLFQCEENGDISVKKAPWGKTLAAMAGSTGTTRRFTRDSFSETLKASLTEQNMSLFNFYKRDTLADLKGATQDNEIAEKQKCASDLKAKISAYEAALKEYAQIPAFDATKLKAIEAELATARTGLPAAEKDVSVCQDKNDVFKRVRSAMEEVIEDICKKDLSNPQTAWVLDSSHSPKIFALMSGFNFDVCGSSGSVESRISECGEQTTLKNGAKVSLVSVQADKIRIYRDEGSKYLYSSLVSNCETLNSLKSGGRKNWRPANNAIKIRAFGNPEKNQKLPGNAIHIAENPHFYEAMPEAPVANYYNSSTKLPYVMAYSYTTPDTRSTKEAEAFAAYGTSASLTATQTMHCVSLED
jgi:hypothetical protein